MNTDKSKIKIKSSVFICGSIKTAFFPSLPNFTAWFYYENRANVLDGTNVLESN
jgi:hypothetical protein